jgi:hypothetical protein
MRGLPVYFKSWIALRIPNPFASPALCARRFLVYGVMVEQWQYCRQSLYCRQSKPFRKVLPILRLATHYRLTNLFYINLDKLTVIESEVYLKSRPNPHYFKLELRAKFNMPLTSLSPSLTSAATYVLLDYLPGHVLCGGAFQ